MRFELFASHVVLFSVLVCCIHATRPPQSIDIRYQKGVVITSAQVVDGREPSTYFRYLYMHKTHPQWTDPDYFPEQ